MSSAMSQQYAFRAQKSIGLVGGSPNYEEVKGFTQPDTTARTYTYSPDGRLYAYVLPDCVRIFYAEDAQLNRELPLPNVLEVSFSPRGTYVSTWERPAKQEGDAQHKNLRVFSVSSGDELASFTQKSQNGWELQFTIHESHAIRLVNQEVQVFHPADWSKGVVDKLRLDNLNTISLSPGLNPSVAVFTSKGKNGQPATIRLYSLTALSTPPICSKTTFQADNAQFKWNTIGTQVLASVRTDVDMSNKSYYGESRLYLLSSAGTFDGQVIPPKEGPIHDFAWNPNSKEFGIVCGFTPMQAAIFDTRLRIAHDFGLAPQNFVSFNPQGRLVAFAGFGNMSGRINVYDRSSLKKVATIDAPNTTFFEWSPCGRFMLTATLSPRLRVDNGIKIWHCSGPLVHLHPIEELYQTSWRPIPVDSVSAFPPGIPQAPAPNASVALFQADAKPTPTKMGAYRPPGARGSEASTVYLRGDSEPNSGANTPTKGGYGRGGPGQGQNGYGGGGAGRGRGRYVPGAAPPTSPPANAPAEKRPKNKKNKSAKRLEGEALATNGTANGNGPNASMLEADASKALAAAAAAVVGSDLPSGPQTPRVDAAPSAENANAADVEAIARRMRNLRKKVKAIEELKERKSKGEKLEDTQFKKIEAEKSIMEEMQKLSLQSGIAIDAS